MLNRCMYISLFEWQQQHWPWHREQVPGHVILTSDTVLHLSFSRGQKGLRSRHSLSEEKEILFKKNWTERPKSYIKLLGLKQVFCKVTLQCQIYTTKKYIVFLKIAICFIQDSDLPSFCVYHVTANILWKTRTYCILNFLLS